MRGTAHLCDVVRACGAACVRTVAPMPRCSVCRCSVLRCVHLRRSVIRRAVAPLLRCLRTVAFVPLLIPISPTSSTSTSGSGHGQGDPASGRNVETAFPWEFRGDPGTVRKLSRFPDEVSDF